MQVGGATRVGKVTVVPVFDEGVTQVSVEPPEPLQDLTATASVIVQPAVVIVTELVPQVHDTGGSDPPDEHPDGKQVPSGLAVIPEPAQVEGTTWRQRVTGVQPACATPEDSTCATHAPAAAAPRPARRRNSRRS